MQIANIYNYIHAAIICRNLGIVVIGRTQVIGMHIIKIIKLN